MWTNPAGKIRRPPSLAWLSIALIVAGMAFRAPPLTQNRFHPDEALFATLARLVVSGRDPWLSQTALLVDKPPLAYYLVAGSMALMGPGEIAARLPSLLSSVIGLALILRLARQFWRQSGAAAIALLTASVSPFAILFAPTVFTDSLMVMWLLASLSLMASRRWGWGGLLLGLSIATKQSALFFTPLVLLIGLVELNGPISGRLMLTSFLRFATGLALIVILIFVWDRLRQPAVSFWIAGEVANNPGRLARSLEVWPRALGWLNWMQYFTANRAADVLLAVPICGVAPLELRLHARQREAAISLILASFALTYLATNWLIAFPILDRYLLPMVAVLALLAGRGVVLLGQSVTRIAASIPAPKWALFFSILLAALMIPSALQASRSRYPVGGDHGPNDGIDQIAAYLKVQPYGTVVYSRGLDWLVRYYLFDAYIFPVYVDTPMQLSKDLKVFGRTGPARYMLLSSSEPVTELAQAATGAGFELQAVVKPGGRDGQPTMTLYRLNLQP